MCTLSKYPSCIWSMPIFEWNQSVLSVQSETTFIILYNFTVWPRILKSNFTRTKKSFITPVDITCILLVHWRKDLWETELGIPCDFFFLFIKSCQFFLSVQKTRKILLIAFLWKSQVALLLLCLLCYPFLIKSFLHETIVWEFAYVMHTRKSLQFVSCILVNL